MPILLLLLAMTSYGADTETVAFSVPTETQKEVDAPIGKLSAQLGGALTTGNSVYYSVSGGLNGSFRWKRSQIAGSFDGQYVRGIADTNSDGRLDEDERLLGLIDTARQLGGLIRYDWFVSDRSSIYGILGALSQPFAGLDIRGHEQIGYGHAVVKTPDALFRIELGLDYAQEKYVQEIDPNFNMFLAGRIMMAAEYTFNQHVKISNTLEVYENVFDVNDLRLYNVATLSTKISDRFSLNLSHRLAFDNVPVEGYQSLDQSTFVTLVANIFNNETKKVPNDTSPCEEKGNQSRFYTPPVMFSPPGQGDT